MLSQYLREKRSQRDVSLKEISKATRIRLEYLKALEDGEFHKIPGEVYVRGYIVEYLRYLNIDPDEALKIYSSTKKEPQIEREKSRLTGRVFPGYAYIGLIIILLAIPLYFYLRTGHTRPAVITKVAKHSASGSSTSEIINLIKPSVNSAEADYKNRHILKVEASEESWILIRIDNDITYSMVLRPGEVRTWSAEKGFYLKTGNAGGIKLSFDNRLLGSPGKRGAVVSLNLPEDIKRFIKH